MLLLMTYLNDTNMDTKMKRKFKDGAVIIDGKKYAPIFPHYDISILGNDNVEISRTTGGQHKFCFIPTQAQKSILGVRASFIILKEVNE